MSQMLQQRAHNHGRPPVYTVQWPGEKFGHNTSSHNNSGHRWWSVQIPAQSVSLQVCRSVDWPVPTVSPTVLEQRDAAEYFERILYLTSPEASKVRIFFFFSFPEGHRWYWSLFLRMTLLLYLGYTFYIEPQSLINFNLTNWNKVKPTK